MASMMSSETSLYDEILPRASLIDFKPSSVEAAPVYVSAKL